MSNRTKRFFAALNELEHGGAVQRNPSGLDRGWRIATGDHPIDGHKMALAVGLNHIPEGRRHTVGDPMAVRAVLTASYVAGAVEAAFGVDIHHIFRNDGRLALLPAGDSTCGLVHCIETAPATKGTAQVRAGWKLDTTTTNPGIDKFRGTPVIGKLDEHVIYFGSEMPAGWPTGDIVERPEAAITNRTAAFHASDKLYLGVPWIHKHGELILDFRAELLRKAAQHVRSLVTPAPEPDDSD